MIESTARADRVNLQDVSSPAFNWEVTDKPVAVRMPFVLIDRMEREVVENFRSLTSRGSEIGGILLGSAGAGNPSTVCVDDYEVIPCDYSRGPLYRLSDADMGRFERAIEQRAEGRLRVVGFFRSHTRKGLSLDAEDLSFFGARFRDPSNVILLVRPFATKASTAGFFIRENGVVRGDSSYLEFPFRSSQLSASRPSLSATEASAPHPAVSPAVTAPPAPAPPKPATRAHVVPIASRREILLPVPPEPPKDQSFEPKAIEIKAVPVATAAPPPADKEREAEGSKERAAAIAPVQEVAGNTREHEGPVPPPAAMVEEEAAEALTPKAASNRGRSVMVAALAVVAMGLCTVLFVYPGVLRTGVHIASSAGQDTPPLSLRVERTGADILLTWNRDSTAIQRAAHAVLTISDGERHDNYDMDLGQLRNDGIVYSPLTTDVSFRMEVAGQGNAKPVSESVRVLRTRPSPMPDGSETAIETARNNAKPVAPPNASNSSDADDSSVQPVPAPARTVVPSKPFNTESLADRLHPAAPVAVALPEAPALNSGPAAPSTLPSIGAAPVAPAPFIPAPAPAAPAKQAPASPATAGGRIVQAQLIFSKQPEYPKLARQMGIKGSVEVLATIGADGHVKHVKVEKGHPLLAKAASDAVMQWVYRPTLLNGAAVQNETHITLNFTGDK